MLNNIILNRTIITKPIIVNNSLRFNFTINDIKSFHTTSKKSLNPFNWVVYLDKKNKSINIELNKELINENVKLLSDRLWQTYESKKDPDITMTKIECYDFIKSILLQMETSLFKVNGYSLIKNAIPKEELDKLKKNMADDLLEENDPDDLEEIERRGGTREALELWMEYCIIDYMLDLIEEAFPLDKNDDDYNDDDDDDPNSKISSYQGIY